MVCNLKLPVGIDSFEKIRKNEFYYIDKTKLIEQLVETGGEVTLFTRPRRFGKTLNMSMLKAFLETGADVSLFEGLYIAENKALCDEYMGKYPVIFLSLKSVEGLNFEAAKYRITELIGRKHSVLISFWKVTTFLTMKSCNIKQLPGCKMESFLWMRIFWVQVSRYCHIYYAGILGKKL